MGYVRVTQRLPVVDMKQVTCSSRSCPSRRVHHERPDEPRGEQHFWVPADCEGPWFCSIECSVYFKSEQETPSEPMVVSTEEKKEEE